MGNPKRKLSAHRRGNRNANKGLKPPAMGLCSKCGHEKRPHAVCPNCGSYRGRQVIEV